MGCPDRLGDGTIDEIMVSFYLGLPHINPLHSVTNSQEYKRYTELYRGIQDYKELTYQYVSSTEKRELVKVAPK